MVNRFYSVVSIYYYRNKVSSLNVMNCLDFYVLKCHGFL